MSDENAGVSQPYAGKGIDVAARELGAVQDAEPAGATHLSPRVQRPSLSPRYRPKALATDR